MHNNNSFKEISYNEDARAKLASGVKQLAQAVKVTLGPKGRTVIIDKAHGSPITTKDGVTVAREVKLKDKMENIGAAIVADAAIKTATEAGDGTTTAVVLADAIFRRGLKDILSQSNPVDLKKGMIIAQDQVVNFLMEKKKNVQGSQEIANIATISANNDREIGKLISDAIEEVGKDGVITVEENKAMTTTVNIVEGLQFDKGYLSQHFVNSADGQKCELSNPFILLTDKRLSNIREIVAILDFVAQQGASLVIMADQIEGDLLPILIVNKLKGSLVSVAVQAPSYGNRRKEILEDIAIAIHGKVICEENLGGSRIEKIGIPGGPTQTGFKVEENASDWLGKAERVVVTKDDITIYGGFGLKDQIEARVEKLKQQVDESDNDWEKEKLQERIAKLTSGIAMLKVGAPTEIEMKEKKDRVDDAVAATKAAMSHGIIVGGGVALVRASKYLDDVLAGSTPPSFENDDQKRGYFIIRDAIKEPLLTIAFNAGKNGESILEKVLNEDDFNYGYNAATETYGDLVQQGVIDPVAVTKCALINSISIVSTMLSCEALMHDVELVKPHEEEDPTMGMM